MGLLFPTDIKWQISDKKWDNRSFTLKFSNRIFKGFLKTFWFYFIFVTNPQWFSARVPNFLDLLKIFIITSRFVMEPENKKLSHNLWDFLKITGVHFIFIEAFDKFAIYTWIFLSFLTFWSNFCGKIEIFKFCSKTAKFAFKIVIFNRFFWKFLMRPDLYLGYHSYKTSPNRAPPPEKFLRVLVAR